MGLHMILVTPEKIAEVMSLCPLPHSFAELDERVASGLPKASLKSSLKLICNDSDEQKHLLYRIIPEATYKRRKEKLSAEESARAERLARTYAIAQYVWDSADAARAFLHAPHPLLQDQTPLEVAMTELGARRIEELLWKLYYGIAA